MLRDILRAHALTADAALDAAVLLDFLAFSILFAWFSRVLAWFVIGFSRFLIIFQGFAGRCNPPGRVGGQLGHRRLDRHMAPAGSKRPRRRFHRSGAPFFAALHGTDLLRAQAAGVLVQSEPRWRV